MAAAGGALAIAGIPLAGINHTLIPVVGVAAGTLNVVSIIVIGTGENDSKWKQIFRLLECCRDDHDDLLPSMKGSSATFFEASVLKMMNVRGVADPFTCTPRTW